MGTRYMGKKFNETHREEYDLELDFSIDFGENGGKGGGCVDEIKVMFNAIMERLDVQGARQEAMAMDLHQLNGRVARLEQGFEEMKSEFAGLKNEMGTVKSEIHQLNDRVAKLEQGFGEMKDEFAELKREIRSLRDVGEERGKKLDAVSHDLLLFRRETKVAFRGVTGTLKQFNEDLELTIERVDALEQMAKNA
ncbi:hypothetical protein CULT_410038 [[Clostridium] ultunense Esp]|nr:hypothetical protein CULT_410038 [[Clostridium] ultunense Esp]